MSNISVKVNVGGGYNVTIGNGILESCGDYIRSVSAPCKAAVITDSTVSELYLSPVLESLRASGFDTISYAFPQGEGSKNLSTLSDILEYLAENGLTRSDIVVALGGGVTGDMAGFAAGVYQRGIRFAQIPTTLLAAVDSSVGGKTAVDLKAGKNLAGVFMQPISVVCDTDTFKTLTPEIFADGAAETIKYGVLTDKELFYKFDTGNIAESLPEIIAKCVLIKGALVEKDERDTGDRRFLNLGHTMGHAIEKLSGYTFPHGHAVAVGMVMITRAGEKMGLTKPGTSDEIARILKKNNLPVSSPFDAEELYLAACGDKKRMGGNITVIMAEEIGKCFLKTIPVSDLREIAILGKES
jgi:3-dehydroquinate synthase